MTETRPDFFIVGAPKCGTTSLSEYLRTHPQIFVCNPKEPFYYSSDYPDMSKVRGEAEYLALFADAKASQIRIGEATAIYLNSAVACENILAATPDARIVVMLRNPIEMIPSYHAQQLVALNEDVADLAEAWDLQEARARGERIPEFCIDPKLLFYREMASFGAQVDRLLRICPREQVQFILFEDLKADAGAVYATVLDFLDLEHDGKHSFPTHNQRSTFRSGTMRSLREALARAPGTERAFIALAEATGIKGALKRLVRKPAKSKRLDPQLVARLQSTFAPDIELLSRLLDRDLSHWTPR
ncbi:sulfotransferase [Tropicimonas sp. TH_r6]|uniref:sulfotransferase family protein n=1 Tax=Tropicimonas sp. TH_r6 TaxID=3082085 RepID=UPI0029549893|nr:sulfotransferase [Tropicimonas sp. TH_r6]MDV7144300.1 sulfotransferase [Tropicimonas sp. TH_r6]